MFVLFTLYYLYCKCCIYLSEPSCLFYISTQFLSLVYTEPGLPESGNNFWIRYLFLLRLHSRVKKNVRHGHVTNTLERSWVVESAVKTPRSMHIKWQETEVEIPTSNLPIAERLPIALHWNHSYHSTQTRLVRIAHFAITLICVRQWFSNFLCPRHTKGQAKISRAHLCSYLCKIASITRVITPIRSL